MARLSLPNVSQKDQESRKNFTEVKRVVNEESEALAAHVAGAGAYVLGSGLRIEAGTVTITPSAANTPTSATITFATAFAAAPYVVVSARSAVPGTEVTGVAFSNPTTDNFLAWVTRANTTATVLNWMAVGT